jgi:hypothetical protein
LRRQSRRSKRGNFRAPCFVYMRGFDLFTASKPALESGTLPRGRRRPRCRERERNRTAHHSVFRSERRRSPRLEPEEDSEAAETHSERTPPIGLFQQPAGA